MPTIDDLAKLAERHHTMIMHLTSDSAHYYLAQIEGTTYCYRSSKERVGTSGGASWIGKAVSDLR